MPLKKTLPLSQKEVEGDPLNVVPRMYAQVARLLGQLEAQKIVINAKEEDGVTIPQRIGALIAAGRIMKMMQDLKKGNENAGAGSAIEKYAAAFTPPHDPSGREPKPRPANLVQFDRTDPDTDPYADDDSD